MITLSLLLLISIICLVSMIGYKYARLSRDSGVSVFHGSYINFLASDAKDILIFLLHSANDKIVKRAVARAKITYKDTVKRIVEKRVVFDDVVKGKGLYDIDENQKGATSLFLKKVTEHKKKIQKNREDNK